MPVEHLRAFGIGVVFVLVPENAIFRGEVGFGQNHRLFVGPARGFDDLRQNAVIRRQNAAVRQIESGAVHAEIVVDGDDVFVRRNLRAGGLGKGCAEAETG